MDTRVNMLNIFTSEHFNLQKFPLVPNFRQVSNSDLATSLAMHKPLDVSWKVVKVFSTPMAVSTALLSGCGGPCLCRSEISKEY